MEAQGWRGKLQAGQGHALLVLFCCSYLEGVNQHLSQSLGVRKHSDPRPSIHQVSQGKKVSRRQERKDLALGKLGCRAGSASRCLGSSCGRDARPVFPALVVFAWLFPLLLFSPNMKLVGGLQLAEEVWCRRLGARQDWEGRSVLGAAQGQEALGQQPGTVRAGEELEGGFGPPGGEQG